MIEEEFFLQQCYSDNEDDLLGTQDLLMHKFAVFCEKLYRHRLKLESAIINRKHLLGFHCLTITGKVSGRAEDVAAMMVAGRIA